ncbi:MAG TPA: hypothetical protein VFI23_10915 [Rhizomicrobium sp.]|nr:hypothetical protein [Rhizomicrobium sp.]
MKPVFLFLFLCASAQAFAAEPVVRLKAKLTAFDGQVMTLEPVPVAASQPSTLSKLLGAKPAPQASLTVSILPETRYVASQRTDFAAIKPGDYAGAAVEDSNGNLRAQDVYLYAPALRGSGEGRFSEAGRLIVNGTVREVKPADKDNKAKSDGGLTLHYRGAMLSGAGAGRTVCEGRASPPAYASALACEADAAIAVPADTPVSALTVGDKSLLVPGRVVTVAMTKAGDGKNIAPGVIVEKPLPVEKPQSAP